MTQIELLKHILQHSKQYSFEGTCLDLTDYNTGKRVSIDLYNLIENADPDLVNESIQLAGPSDEDEEDY